MIRQVYLLGFLSFILFSFESSAYVAHEWGTFTSVQGSDGNNVVGLWREEEELPDFVQGRGACANVKCADFVIKPSGPMSVNQKLETPVLYFYSEKRVRVSAEVEFPKGLITQYYPNATRFSPPRGQVRQISGGKASWDIEISNKALPIPEVDASSVYAPARDTAANYLNVGTENEKFIFYRGLGNFDLPFRVTSKLDGTIEIANQSNQTIPAIFLVRFENDRGEIVDLGALAPHATKVSRALEVTAQSPKTSAYLASAKQVLALALKQTGLYEDESISMVNTWERSYFLSPGLKVLYVVPNQWTDNLLPIKLNPAPQEMVRTLVGRIEVLLASEEKQYLELFQQAAKAKTALPLKQFGRFAEPKIRRLLALTKDAKLIEYVNSQFSFNQD